MRHLLKVPLTLRDMEDAEDHEFVFVSNVDAVHNHVRQVRHDNFTRAKLAASPAETWQRAEQSNHLNNSQSSALGSVGIMLSDVCANGDEVFPALP